MIEKKEVTKKQIATQVSDDGWLLSDYAKRYFAVERAHIAAGLRQSIGPTVLQLGQYLPASVVADFDLPLLVKTNYFSEPSSDLVVDPAFLPFAPDVFSTVVLPHVLERHELPHQVLREAHRVLMPEGHIVLTGFNPNSLIGAQRWIRPRAVIRGRYYSVSRVIDWLQLLGFEVVTSSMFHYAPLSRSKRLIDTFQFIESVGDRWLPMMGGGYIVSAKKRDASATMVGRLKFRRKRSKLVAAAAKTQTKAVTESCLDSRS
ncbi:MAG: SAM-dependent methyltransferase [Arenicella sp.]